MQICEVLDLFEKPMKNRSKLSNLIGKYCFKEKYFQMLVESVNQ